MFNPAAPLDNVGMMTPPRNGVPQRSLLLRLARRAGAAALGMLFAVAAQAGTLDPWHVALRETRVLAENDAPAAHAEARRLQDTLPADATTGDRVDLLNVLSRIEIYRALAAPAAEHAQQALALARRADYRVGQAEALLNQSINDVNRGRLAEASTALLQSVALLEGVDRPDLLGQALMRTALMYRRNGSVESSVDLCVRTLALARRSDDPIALASAHQCMAIGYDLGQQSAEAIAQFQEMARQARRAHSTLLEGHALLGIGMITAKRDKAGEALIWQSIEMFRRMGSPFSESLAFNTLASLHTAEKRYAEALPLFERALAAQPAEHAYVMGTWYGLLGRSRAYEGLGQREAAKADARHAVQVAERIGLPLYRADAAQRLAELTAAEGRFREAYRLGQDAAQLRAKAMLDPAGSRVTELARRFEAQQRDREIAELTRRNERQSAELRERALEGLWLWTVLASSVAALVGTAWFVVRQRRSNRLLETANQQLQQSERQLQNRTDVLRSVVDNIADGVCVADPEGRLYLVNPTAQALLGPAPLGGRIGDWADEYQIFLPDASAPMAESELPLLRALHGEATTQLEVLLRRTDTPEERWLSITTRPLTQGAGGAHGAVAVFSDVTERRRAEAERQRMLDQLTQREHEYRTLAENLPDLVVRYNRGMQRIYSNPALQRERRLTAAGWKLDHDGSILEWPYQPPWSEYLRRMRQVLDTGVPDEFIVTRPDIAANGTISFSTRIVAERERDGEALSVLAIAHDVSAMQTMQDRLQTSRDLLRELAARAEAAREDERRRIARELHDDLGQLLTSLRMRLATQQLRSREADAVATWETLTVLVDRTIAVTRDVVAQLRPAALDSGLVVALEWLIDDVRRHTGIRCVLNAPEQDIDMADEQATVMFRIVQESLTNVARHAHASRVDITIDTRDDEVVLTVRDNGRGFDPSRPPHKSFGLAGMRERGYMLRGEVTIDSRLGHGTTVQLRMPLRQPSPRAAVPL